VKSSFEFMVCGSENCEKLEIGEEVTFALLGLELLINFNYAINLYKVIKKFYRTATHRKKIII